jgi:hypothetical protein
VSSNAGRYAAGLAAAAVAALSIAVSAPVATTVIGLICFGILHNVLELRYVLGRFGDVLSGTVGLLLVALVSGIAVTRLGAAYLGGLAQPAEIALGYAVLGAGAWIGLRGQPRYAVLALLLGAAGVSLSHPAYHVVVLAHLHNLVPLVFLWEWSRRLRAPVRAWFRGVQVAWVLVVPALVLAGVLDRWVNADVGVVRSLVGDGARVVASVAWPDAPEVAMRWLVAFAFLQTMHYVVWVWFLPRAAPEATAAFEARWPVASSRRVWGVGVALAAALGALLLTPIWSSRSFSSCSPDGGVCVRVSLVTDVAPQPTGTGIAVFLVLALVVLVGAVVLAVLLLRRSRR